MPQTPEENRRGLRGSGRSQSAPPPPPYPVPDHCVALRLVRHPPPHPTTYTGIRIAPIPTDLHHPEPPHLVGWVGAACAA